MHGFPHGTPMSKPDVYVDPKVRKVRELYADLLSGEFYSLPIRRQLEWQGERLTVAQHMRNDAVCFQIGSWHPELVGSGDARILSNAFSLDDGRTTIAREHGFKDWNDVISIGDRRSNVQFELAVNAMLAGDLPRLKRLLDESPDLISARSQYGHRATLLHYAGNNGVESYRQVVPSNLAEIVDLLIARGADPASKAEMYGGSTPRELFESSMHPHGSKVRADVLRRLGAP
jgi:hypothetical protein